MWWRSEIRLARSEIDDIDTLAAEPLGFEQDLLSRRGLPVQFNGTGYGEMTNHTDNERFRIKIIFGAKGTTMTVIVNPFRDPKAYRFKKA